MSSELLSPPAVDGPLRRYLTHALPGGSGTPAGVRLSMRGRIKVGAWLPFTAEQETRSDGFSWRARVGAGPLTVLRVVDRFEHGSGSMDGRLFGRLRVLHAAGEDTNRSAAGRAALEAATFAPGALLPGGGVTWRAEGDDLIAANWDLAPERPKVSVRIDERGAIRSVSGPRWGDTGDGTWDYIPCGAVVHAERRFGDLVVPSNITAGWWFDTPRWAPFFRAEITSAEALPR